MNPYLLAAALGVPALITLVSVLFAAWLEPFAFDFPQPTE